MDWPRFWGQFSETIDKTSVAAITKFSYLRELLDTKAKRTIEALPFTSEGYNRAKSILHAGYCTTGNHRASYCPSKSVCQRCHKRHHTSICDATHPPSDANHPPTPTRGVALTTNQLGEGLFPVLVVEVNGIKCRALIDSGAGSSYVSAKLIDLLRVKPTAVQTNDMLMSTKVATFEVYDLSFQSVNHQFTLPVKATKINNSELLSIDNPNYRELPDKYPHLRGVYVNNIDTKARLPVHVILESREYARIKTETKPRIGEDDAPIAKLTKFGWCIMSPGQEFDKNVM